MKPTYSLKLSDETKVVETKAEEIKEKDIKTTKLTEEITSTDATKNENTINGFNVSKLYYLNKAHQTEGFTEIKILSLLLSSEIL